MLQHRLIAVADQLLGLRRADFRPLFNVADNGSFLTHITGINTGLVPNGQIDP